LSRQNPAPSDRAEIHGCAAISAEPVRAAGYCSFDWLL
jgi:hypothetical protein